MKVIVTPPGAGKTQRVIDEAYRIESDRMRGDVYIVCATHRRAESVFRRIGNQGLPLPMPITFAEFLAGRYGRRISYFVIDDVDDCIQSVAHGGDDCGYFPYRGCRAISVYDQTRRMIMRPIECRGDLYAALDDDPAAVLCMIEDQVLPPQLLTFAVERLPQRMQCQRVMIAVRRVAEAHPRAYVREGALLGLASLAAYEKTEFGQEALAALLRCAETEEHDMLRSMTANLAADTK